ncbi:MAG: hypothetical protein DIU78_005250 [Pseudomonadota bacterium]
MSESEGMPRARLREAFERVLPELRALPEEALRKVTVDVPTAVATILGAIPKIRELREQIQEELPKHDLARFDRLEEYTLALAYAHGAYIAASRPPRSIDDINAEAMRLRELLLADAAVLVLRGLFDKARIAEIRLGNGYRDTAFDLVALVSLYRSRWSEIEGKTGISLAELEQAEIVADRLITAVGEREQAPIKRTQAIEDRMRALTLCVDVYNQTRRAIAYLRFDHDDAHIIAPSLYAGRGGRSRAENESEDVSSASLEPEDPEADKTEPVPIESGISPPSTEATSLPPEVRVGFPGGSPSTE